MALRPTFRVLVYKSLNAQYWPDGAYQDVACSHVVEGYFGVNMAGEIVPAQGATAVPPDGQTNFDQDTIGIRAGHVYSNVAQFEDDSFKSTVLIKDMHNQNSFYADLDSYNTAVATCNDCCIEP